MARDDLSAGWDELYDDLHVSKDMEPSPDQEDHEPDYSDLISDEEDETSGFRVRPDWMGRGTYASEHDEFAPYW